MAPKNSNLRYVHNPNSTNIQKGLSGQERQPSGVYILPAISLTGQLNAQRPGGRRINQYKTSLNFGTARDDPVYKAWRNAVKDQLSARNYTDINSLPNGDFREIWEGMRRLRPACDLLVAADAANNIQRIQEIDDAIIQLIKDAGKKLTHTILTKRDANQEPAAP
jgi:hypothetical protein